MLSSRQQKAIRLFLAGTYTDGEIADECGVSRDQLRKWKRDEEFLKELKDRYALMQEVDIKWRLDRNRSLLAPIYRTIQKKIEDGDLGQMRLKELFDILQKLVREMRDDDKILALGDDNQVSSEESELGEMDEISKRYSESEMKGVFRKTSNEIQEKTKELINIFSPDEKTLTGLSPEGHSAKDSEEIH